MIISNVTISKGVDLFEDTNNKDLVQKASSFALSGLIDNTELQEEILSLAGNRGAYMAVNLSDIIEKIKSLFRRQKIEILGQETAWLPVSIYHAYCPNVENAKVKIECKDTNSTETETSVEILGIGGGATYTLELTSSIGVEADHKSFALACEFQSEWEHVRLTDRKGGVREFCRLVDIHKNHRRSNTRILTHSPVFSPNQIDATEEFDLTGDMVTTKKLTIESGSKLKVSNKLKLEQFGLEAGADITTINQFDIEYEYTLPGGHKYTAVHLRDAAYWLWK